MRKYEVTLTLSKKRIPVYADSHEKAMVQMGEQLTDLMMLDCKEEEVENILISSPNAMPASDTNRQADKPGKYSHLSPDMEKLCRALENLCLNSGCEEEEIEEELDNISGFDDFEPLLHWDFQPVCGMEVEGSEDIFPNRRRNRLFGKNGVLLDTSMQGGVSALSTVAESYELWLLEDMTLAVIFCCSMTVKGEDNYSESATFRFPVSGRYPELSGDFDALDFLASVEERICDALHLD